MVSISKLGYINIYHGPLNFDITWLYCYSSGIGRVDTIRAKLSMHSLYVRTCIEVTSVSVGKASASYTCGTRTLSKILKNLCMYMVFGSVGYMAHAQTYAIFIQCRGRRHGVGKRPPWKKIGWALPTLEICLTDHFDGPFWTCLHVVFVSCRKFTKRSFMCCSKTSPFWQESTSPGLFCNKCWMWEVFECDA